MRGMSVTLFICCTLFVIFLLDGCGSKSSSSDISSAATTTQQGAIDGAALYTDNCRPCHGVLASSNKRGVTAAQIQGAIANNTGGMGQFSNFSSAQIQAIANALSAAQ